MSRYDVIIIGAGPAGLTAAYLLTKRGRSCLVLEKDPKDVGGLARSVSHRGFRFDIGTHRFYTQSEEVKELWKEWLPRGMHQCERKTRIFYKNKYFAYPLEPLAALYTLGIRESIRCLISFFESKVSLIQPERSFEDWVVNRFGRRLFEVFFKTYTEKVWGISTQNISRDWAAQRIRSLSASSIIKSSWVAMWKRDVARKEPRSLIRNFQYPELGPGMMWEACAAKYRALGGELIQGVRTQRVRRTEREWEVEYTDASGNPLLARADSVVSSMPLPQLLRQLVPTPAPAALAAAGALKFRDFIVVNVIIKGKELFPDHWLYIHDPTVQMGRISNYRAFSEKMVPPDGQYHSYGVEYFCNVGDALWSLSEVALGELAERELTQLGFCETSQIVETVVVKQANAYPVYDENYQSNVDICKNTLQDNYRGLYTVGRNGMHHYNNQDHAMLTAIVTVDNILEGHQIKNAWEINCKEEYLEAEVKTERTKNKKWGFSHAGVER